MDETEKIYWESFSQKEGLSKVFSQIDLEIFKKTFLAGFAASSSEYWDVGSNRVWNGQKWTYK